MTNARPLPTPDVVTVYGTTQCVDCQRAKRYLDATRTPYRWIDVIADRIAEASVKAAGYASIPVIVTPSGQVLVEPSNDELAVVVGTAA